MPAWRMTFGGCGRGRCLNYERGGPAFFESQQLPPEKRGISFGALFYRQLQQVTTKPHATENIDQIMLEASQATAACSPPIA